MHARLDVVHSELVYDFGVWTTTSNSHWKDINSYRQDRGERNDRLTIDLFPRCTLIGMDRLPYRRSTGYEERTSRQVGLCRSHYMFYA